MSTYTEAHKKYYERNKEKIFWKTRKYKKEYNKERYKRLREEILAAEKVRKQKKLQEAMLSQSGGVTVTDGSK